MLFLRVLHFFDCGGGYSGVFRMCETEDTFCQWLKKNYQEFACCLIEGRKPLKLAFFSGDTKNQGLWHAIQGAPASFCVTFSTWLKRHSVCSYTARVKVSKKFATTGERS